jgi:hypothetical protein
LKFVLAAISICLTLWSNAQQPLVGVHDGQWFTYADGHRAFLPKDMHDVGNFDNQSIAYFMRHDLYGLIDHEGEIVLSEEYISAKQLKGGYYSFLNKNGFDLVQYENGKLKITSCLSIVDLEFNWFMVTTDDEKFLMNSVGNVQVQLDSTDEIINEFYGYQYVQFDNERLLFDKTGAIVELGNRIPKFNPAFLILPSTASKKIVYPDHEILLPPDARRIRVEEMEIFYTVDGITRIISAVDEHLILEVACDRLNPLGRGLLEMGKGAKLGIITRKGKVICPMKYTTILLQENYLMVRNENGQGVLDLGGNELVPCKYDRLTASRDFFLIRSNTSRYGLLSRITKREILSCKYDRIAFDDAKVRAWSSQKLRIIQLDTNHRVTSDLVLDNVITLDRTKATGESFVDERLYGLGWFKEPIPIYDSLGFKIGERIAWGLKGQNDTLLLKPTFPEPIFVPLADFSLIPSRRIKKNERRRTDDVPETITFSMYSHIAGKRLIADQLRSVDTLDLLTRSYTRFVGEKGLGILTAENKVIEMAYIDGADLRFVRYCQGTKMIKVTSKNIESHKVFAPDWDLNNVDYIPSKKTLDSDDEDAKHYAKFTDAKWNFLDTNGRPVFSKPFSFVHPYLRNTAIVERAGKWGIVRDDSMIVAPIFSEINRFSEISDTLFLVKNTPGGKRFIDTMANAFDNGITRFGMNKGNLSQVNIGRDKVVIGLDYSIISGETRFQKLFENNIFYSKENKAYAIYSESGNQLGSVKLKPLRFIREEYVVSMEKGKKGVVDMDDGVRIPFSYKKIENYGDYVFAINGYENKLFDENLSLLREVKNNTILVDEVSGNYAVITPTKVTVYDKITGKKIGSWKGTKYVRFIDGWLIQAGKESRAVEVSTEKVVNFKFEYKELILMGASGYLIHDTKKYSHYFKSDWEAVTFGFQLRRAKYVGEGRAICRTKEGLLLFGDELEKLYPYVESAKGVFSKERLLLKESENMFFVNVDGDNVFRRKFKSATPFGTSYATVQERSGWTIMDSDGHYQTLPAYDKIEELGSNVFSTNKQALFGIYDSHGNVIVPVEFQKIIIINKNLIQGYKNGEIFYFDRSGSVIHLN